MFCLFDWKKFIFGLHDVVCAAFFQVEKHCLLLSVYHEEKFEIHIFYFFPVFFNFFFKALGKVDKRGVDFFIALQLSLYDFFLLVPYYAKVPSNWVMVCDCQNVHQRFVFFNFFQNLLQTFNAFLEHAKVLQVYFFNVGMLSD